MGFFSQRNGNRQLNGYCGDKNDEVIDPGDEIRGMIFVVVDLLRLRTF